MVLLCLSQDWFTEKAAKKREAGVLVNSEKTVLGDVTEGSGRSLPSDFQVLPWTSPEPVMVTFWEMGTSP